MKYIKLPAFEQWKKDSSATLVARKDDPLLVRLDAPVKSFHETHDRWQKFFILADLFFTLDYWLKLSTTHKKLDLRRKPAIAALFEFTANGLARIFKVTINVLPRELELMFGREMGDHGSKLDHEWDCAAYLTRAQVQKYKLWFRAGKAYMFPWWEQPANAEVDLRALVLADSSKAWNSKVIQGPGWGGFAMSMGRDIYMAKHHATGIGASSNHYHSSYLGGAAVMCAGTMQINHGAVRSVRTDSGHYQPTDEHLVNVALTLKMHGVPLENVYFENYNSTLVSTAADFLAQRGNWNSLQKMRKANLQHIMKRIHERIEDKQLYDFYVNQGYASVEQAAQIFNKYWGWNYDFARKRLNAVIERFETAPAYIQQERQKRIMAMPPPPVPPRRRGP